MGMTIKDTKMHLVMQESYALGKDYRALENALNIIRKYEKIREIVNSKTTRLSYEEGFRQIKEVVENGKTD